MAFTEVSTVRKISGIGDEYTDADLQDFISLAQKEVVSQIQTRVLKEKIGYLDKVRQNKIDGSNQTFYLSKVGNFFGDRDFDGDIDENDVLVYLVENNGSEWLETQITPQSIDNDNLSFTLETAPETGTEIYVTYSYSPLDLKDPDAMISQATAYLASSYLSITENGDDDGRSIRIGNLSIGAGRGTPGGSFFNKYWELMTRLVESTTGGAIWGESFVKI